MGSTKKTLADELRAIAKDSWDVPYRQRALDRLAAALEEKDEILNRIDSLGTSAEAAGHASQYVVKMRDMARSALTAGQES